jgi:mannose-1-phosphate guanylyltransferase
MRDNSAWLIVVEQESDAGAMLQPYRALWNARFALRHQGRANSRRVHQLLVLDAKGRQRAWLPGLHNRLGNVLVQPCCRGTVPAAFLALTRVYRDDPEAIAVVCPSHHLVYLDHNALSKIVHVAVELESWIVVLGETLGQMTIADALIWPGACLGWINQQPVRMVKAFLRKNDLGGFETFQEEVMWNTSIVAGSVRTLMNLGWKHFPRLMQDFEAHQVCIGTREADADLTHIYEKLPVLSFTSDLLERIPRELAVIECMERTWGHWGKARSITESFWQIGQPTMVSLARP